MEVDLYMDFIIRDKPKDATIIFIDGGFNSCLMAWKLLEDPYIRTTSIFLTHLQYTDKYLPWIRKQLRFFRNERPSVDFRLFKIDNITNEDKVIDAYSTRIDIKYLMEKYANEAILGYFAQHFSLGSRVEIYIGSCEKTYQEFDFDPRFKDHVHYPLKEETYFHAMWELIQSAPTLASYCTNCEDFNNMNQYCGSCDRCNWTYGGLYDICNRYRYGAANIWVKDFAKQWFDRELVEDKVYDPETDGNPLGDTIDPRLGNRAFKKIQYKPGRRNYKKIPLPWDKPKDE